LKTNHKILIADARSLAHLKDESIDLVVTSPPYPMIRMWDGLFSSMSIDAKKAMAMGDGNAAFEAMHLELDKVWRELKRVLRPGAFACINIGDATRTISERFQLYSNHSRIISSFRALKTDSLPVILWRKQTNAPNKFMGSGMLPAGAYVTLEHEYILVFRKGPKREFTSRADKAARMESAFFWEERNCWFSDVWDFKGTSQDLVHGDLRSRSAAYPLELAYRCVNMFSLYGDTVLDPFMGTGTTALASIACGRNSIGVEIDRSFSSYIADQEKRFMPLANELLASRISAHKAFIASYTQSKGALKYRNENHGFPVMTRQETGIRLFRIADIKLDDALEAQVSYENVGNLYSATKVQRETETIENSGAQQLALGL
jgi:DNA modification methylase